MPSPIAKISLKRVIVAGICLLLFAAVGTAGYGFMALRALRPQVVALPAAEVQRVDAHSGLTDCFWRVTVSRETHNILFPDTAALYWGTQYRTPPGSRLALRGQFPHARYMSFNAYDVQGQPLDGAYDLMLAPEPGSTNPFLPGAARNLTDRNYGVNIASVQLEAGQRMDETSRAPNTLYAPQTGAVQLVYRVYVPDQGQDVRGGVPLPQPVLTLADGRQLEGAAACNALAIDEASLLDIRVSANALHRFYNLPGARSPYHPAQQPPRWTAFFNGRHALLNTLLHATPLAFISTRVDATRKGGFYSNLDNTYMSAQIDSRFGEVLVLRGQAPITPRTQTGSAHMPTAQLRYWSLCKYRSTADTAVDSCLYDEQIPQDVQGHYTIVVSTAAQRPKNARAQCGVAWLDWGTAGNGMDNPKGGFLALRHMLPAADFGHSLFSVRVPGEEAQVLGPYFPVSTYTNTAAFDSAQACP